MSYYEDLSTARREIDRLTAALHESRCHPDYTYTMTTCMVNLNLMEGWEINTEYQAAPGDCCWRRRRNEPT